MENMEYKLQIPISENEVRNLRIGDVVYLKGLVYTFRDMGHRRALELAEKDEKLPVELYRKAVFHCGPIMKKENGKWFCISAGPTTSSRLNYIEPVFIKKFRPSAIIGKGGMDKKTLDALEEVSCVYLAATGGTAVALAKRITDVKGVFWYDLGMPESLWVLEVKNFGPLIVAMDAHQGSIYDEVSKKVKINETKVRKKLASYL